MNDNTTKTMTETLQEPAGDVLIAGEGKHTGSESKPAFGLYSPQWYQAMRDAVQWGIEQGLIERPKPKRRASDET
jgi:hypothetical protein